MINNLNQIQVFIFPFEVDSNYLKLIKAANNPRGVYSGRLTYYRQLLRDYHQNITTVIIS